ncbi:GntR family transcriptional regulator [Thalassobius vesicularis]|uniref:GntR family transcriptional regulator n=1 Tax=Thalassobius vesicularis TaxID=1294297 RepID=A0A4S3M9P6_9RHOB|nr:GntR family transcriptional regulator [Thalassobius vesicularis]THD73959.1 GntR family transcriptional regulator [Thalassobius vesicularis]
MAAKDRKTALIDHLKHAILTLELEPGSDLDEVALGEAFELSRTPVREVFRQLDGLGFVELRDNRGARVAALSHTTLRDFFLAAPMIYAAILRLAARNARPAQIEALKAAQAQFREALRTGVAAERALANNRFHEITGEMAGNIYLLPSFQRLLIDHARIGMSFYRPRTSQMVQNLDTARHHHDLIIAAIEVGDEDRAAELAEDHWALSRDQIELFVMPAALDAPLGEITRKTSA